MSTFWRRRIFSLFLTASIGLLPAAARAQFWNTTDSPPATGHANPNLAPFDRLMLDFLVSNQIPGASMAVSYHGKIVYSRGFGWADVDRREPVRPQSLFRIASDSKPFTAVAIMRLLDVGKLSLDSKAFYLMPFALRTINHRPIEQQLAKVTILQLLQHRGGWDRDKSFDPMFKSREIAGLCGTNLPATQEQIIDYMFGQPLDFEPGSQYVYSNFGYCVLGRVIEKVSQMGYEQFVRQSVLKPLGITDMKLGHTRLADRARDEVLYYSQRHEQGQSVFPQDHLARVPGPYGAWCLESMDSHGGWIATAEDLVRLEIAFDDLDHSPLLSASIAHTMFAPPPGSAGAAVYYGCGWQVRPTAGGGFNAWHTGLLAGTSSLMVRRHDGIDWAIVFNTDRTSDGQLAASKIDSLVHVAANAVEHWPSDP